MHRLMLATALGTMAVPALAQTEITFRYNDPDVATIEAAIEAFEAQNPDIAVEVQRIAWPDARTQFLREAAVGTGPDVAHVAFVWPQELGRAGAVLPLNDLVEGGELPSAFADFIATDLARGPDGEIYALPWTTDTFTLVYNAEMLEAAGVAAPTTWDELLDASRKVAEETGKAGFGFPAGSAALNTTWFLANYHWWSHGKNLVEQAEDGSYRMGVSEADIVEVIDYLDAFIGEGGNPEANISGSNWSDPAIMEALVSGEQAMGFMPPGTLREIVATYQERTGEEETPFRTTTIPQGSDGGVSHVGGRSLAINANTDHPEEAWKLIEFLSSGAFFSDHLTVQLPAQKNLLSNLEFGPEMEGYTDQLQNARSWGDYANPHTPIGAMQAELGREFGAVFVGEKSAEDAAASLVSTIEDMLSEQ